jgi:putative transposon-encoded protein
MNIKKVRGTLIIEQVEFNQMVERMVIKNNETSGKITLPKDWVGERVYVIIPKKVK